MADTYRIGRHGRSRIGFGMVPHVIWTYPGFKGEHIRLLCWLHSHDPRFCVRLSLGQVARTLGTNRTRLGERLQVLEDAGFVKVNHPFGPGGTASIVVFVRPWEDLFGMDPASYPTTPGFGEDDYGDPL